MSENIVEVRDLTKQYGKQLALDHVSFQIKKGSIVGLIGPNGAGKTTIMKIMGGLVFPTSGELVPYREKNGLISYGKQSKRAVLNCKK